MMHYEEQQADLAPLDTQVEIVSSGAVGAIVASEVGAQLDAAHKYPRQVKRFLQEAMTLATLSEEVAQSCIYSVPRDGKTISGPSVRLAEIAASAYGNLQFGARIVDTRESEIVAQGVAWDMEKNTRVTIEVSRRIKGRNGRRFSDDMIITTGNAAASIALRNAIFRVVPRAYIDQIYQKVRLVAVGRAETLANRRAEVLARLVKMGATQDRVFAKLGKKGIEDIGLEELEQLIGYGTAIKNGDATVDEVFPAPAPAPAAPTEDGRRISMRGKPKSEPTPAPEDTGEVAERQPGED